ncbi:hypothetical protein DsansV1_C02g0022601 [Dioscorea sansibarensis]
MTRSRRVMHVMMAIVHNVCEVYRFRARHQMAQSLGQIAKFRHCYEQNNEETRWPLRSAQRNPSPM